jgi:hypothetical protein
MTDCRNAPEPTFQKDRSPFSLSDADVRQLWEGQPNREVPEYLLLECVNGFDLEVRVYFGRQEPSASALARAQAELQRLMLPSN